MFAIVRTGGKQYRVAAQDEITVMTLAGDAGSKVTFDEVLMVADGDKVKLGAPNLAGAKVIGEIVEQARVVFKKRRRHNYRRKQGHRQSLTLLRITAVGGAAPKKAAAPKAEKTEAAAEAAPAKKAAPKKAAAKKAE